MSTNDSCRTRASSGDLTPVYPRLGLVGRELRADQQHWGVEATLVHQPDDVLGDSLGDRDRRPCQGLSRRLVEVGISADRLAVQLGVTSRAARRYIAILREAGIPIESVRGPNGGYRPGRGSTVPADRLQR
ncbi:helix-turn-helix domain-containing protein [Lapillicoccus sp.]|uniref:helix-turn-helix domain-containing protein n=1 Tax=Lapillicoccus sp. TaxID=1909287 RepID=UPI003267F8CE